MGLFICVQYSEGTRQGERVLVYEIRQSPSTLGYVWDYALCDYVSGQEVSRVRSYPMSTESGLALFQRMLKDAPGDTLARPAEGRIVVSLRIGEDPIRSLERELLQLCVKGSLLLVDLLSPAALIAGKTVATRHTLSVRNAICEALNSALGWKAPRDRAVPSLPGPTG